MNNKTKTKQTKCKTECKPKSKFVIFYALFVIIFFGLIVTSYAKFLQKNNTSFDCKTGCGFYTCFAKNTKTNYSYMGQSLKSRESAVTNALFNCKKQKHPDSCAIPNPNSCSYTNDRNMTTG